MVAVVGQRGSEVARLEDLDRFDFEELKFAHGNW